MSNTELLEGSVEAIQLVGSFLRENLEAGEQLLQITGSNELCHTCSISVFYEAIQTACMSTITKSTEISVGIIANMVLCEATTEDVILHLDVQNLVINCLEEHSDPNVLAEALRVLANLVYRQKWETVIPLLPNVCLFVQFVVENSLSTRLLAQAYQLVYYVQIYGTENCYNTLYTVWDVHHFYKASLLATLPDMGGAQSVNVCIPAVLNEVFPALQGEMLSNCTGLEWLLLSLDSHTLYCRNASKFDVDTGLVKTVVPACIEFLLSVRAVGWESDTDTVCTALNASSIALTNNEKFLILSILENILYIEDASANQFIGVRQEIFSHCGPYKQGSMHGFTVLLQTMLQIGEDAVLVKDAGAVTSITYLIASLYGADVQHHAPASTEEAYALADQIAHTYTAVRNFVEMLLLEDVARWLKSTFGQADCYLVKALCALKEALEIQMQLHRKGTVVAGAKSIGAVVCDIDSILRELVHETRNDVLL